MILVRSRHAQGDNQIREEGLAGASGHSRLPEAAPFSDREIEKLNPYLIRFLNGRLYHC